MQYYSINDYCRETFGKKLYRLSLDGGFTCPTRDGTLGDRGCIFCSRAGAGEFAARGQDLDAQIEEAKARVAAKHKDGGYIAYFQSFTNTYAPVERLRALFEPVVKRTDIDVLAVATRPDCLEDDKIALLRELNAVKPVWVELGFQTAKEETARFIRRGYDNPVYDDAVKRLKAAGLEVVTHVILCLPGESREEMLETVRCVGDSGVDGIKLQLLHVLEGTDLAALWRKGQVPLPTMEAYIALLEDCLAVLPPELVIHRLTGDGAKRDLLAPLWTGDKKRVLNAIRAAFDRDNVVQGSRWRQP